MLPLHPAAASCIKLLTSCIYSLFNQWKATLQNNVKFVTVYHSMYCRKFRTLSNQTSRCICKCIRIHILCISYSVFHNVARFDLVEILSCFTNTFLNEMRKCLENKVHKIHVHSILLSHGRAVAECLTQDRRVAGSSLTGVTVLCPRARRIDPYLVMVQPRKTRPDITERLLTGM